MLACSLGIWVYKSITVERGLTLRYKLGVSLYIWWYVDKVTPGSRIVWGEKTSCGRILGTQIFGLSEEAHVVWILSPAFLWGIFTCGTHNFLNLVLNVFIGVQCCVSFYSTAQWISHYICPRRFGLLPHPSHHRAL